MFDRFFCDLLGFCARNFPAKSENNNEHLLLTKGCISTFFPKEHVIEREGVHVVEGV